MGLENPFLSPCSSVSCDLSPVLAQGERAVGGNDENGDREGDSPYIIRCHYLHLSTFRHNGKHSALLWSYSEEGQWVLPKLAGGLWWKTFSEKNTETGRMC